MASRCVLAVASAALLGAYGCAQPVDPTIDIGDLFGPPPSSAPAPTTPSGALRRVEWAFNNKRLLEYSEVLAADFRFVFSELDSTGNAYRDVPWTREDELIATQRLFEGGPGVPAASSVILLFDRTLAEFPDPRPGKDPAHHRTINTTVTLTIRFTDGSQIEIRGRAKFFFTRGDSAQIPADLVARGFGPDPNYWYITRWEDDTGAESARTLARAMPSGGVTWGALRARYR